MTTTIRRALIAFLIVSSALFAALAGCAGGAVCFRNSDCDSGYGCKSGACELLSPPSSDAGDAGTAGATGTSGSTGTAGTAGSAGTASVDDAGDAASQNADAG